MATKAQPASQRRDGDNNDAGTVLVEEKIVRFNGDICIKHYERGKFLGKGGFAKCYEFTNMDTRRVSAAKIIDKNTLTKSRAKQKLMSEIKIHRSLHQTNIVGFEHFFEDAENVYIILELCQNQSLNELLRRRKRLHELEVQCYLLQICAAVRYLHSHRVIHRDLKLGNLFLNDKMEVKIGDFGLATKLEYDGERKRTICGTPNYIAPEVLEGKQGHSYEVDIWSIGVIIYTLIIGKPPFETNDVKTTYRRIRMNNYNFPDTVQISDNARDLIQKILNNDPARRPTIDQIMEHPWIQSAGTIPRLLPPATLACPPSQTYIKQFQNQATDAPVTQAPQQQQKSSTDIKEPDNRAVPERVGVTVGDNVKPLTSTQVSEVWVKKWVDYSTKYGLGYYLSNEATGVFFNDSTKIVLDPNGHHIDYMERRSSDRQDVGAVYTLTEYPKELQKKVTLLQHFWSYLEGNVKPKSVLDRNTAEVGQPQRKVKDVVYVKKWMRTRHAIMFRLSNKVVQVNFQDHTEIMLSSETKVVTYVNKQGERSTYPLNSAMESANLEMVKRLKYTKDILTHMLNANSGIQSSPAPTSNQKGPVVEIARDPNNPSIEPKTLPLSAQTGRPQTTFGQPMGAVQPRAQATDRTAQRPQTSGQLQGNIGGQLGDNEF